MLGSNNVDNYHPDFIEMLYKRYSDPAEVQALFTHSHKFFFELARYWPRKSFIYHNPLPSRLLEEYCNIKPTDSDKPRKGVGN